MGKTVKNRIWIAAAGDNCIDFYENQNRAYPGGNPVNVAVYVKRLGGEASYTGAVGSDENGALILGALREKGVDTSHVQILEGNTAISQVKLMDGERVFGDYQEGVLKDFKLREEDIPFLCSHDMVVTGIWGMIEGNLEKISKKIPVAFDFANKFSSPVVQKALPYVTYAFFSWDSEAKEEFEGMYHALSLPARDTDMERLQEFMRTMGKQGPQVVLVTMGEMGSVAWDGERFYRQGIVKCEVRDTMGAGDSFIAGFLYGILKGLTVPKAMEAGARSSAVTLEYFGAW